MSEIDFSGLLPGPVTGRPRRPLSNSASTASWSMRFSLLTMISGAPRSSSRLRRLLRLMTRRQRALLRREDRHGLEDHHLRLVAGVQEGAEHLQALDRAGLLLALAVLDLVL